MKAYPWSDFMHVVETLLVAAAGAALLELVGFPAGLVAGSMLAVTVAALAGRPMKVPLPLARVCFVMIGMLLGAVVTPQTLAGIATWPLSVALLVVAVMVMLAGTACYLHWVHGWDALSALLGASPGSMAQVLALSADLGADIRGIAIVQVMRVLLIVLGVPAGLALFGSTVAPVAAARAEGTGSWLEFAALVGASTPSALAMLRIRFPGGLMFGAMFGSAVLHGSGLVHASVPGWLGSAAVVVLGALAGARFARTGPRLLLSYLGAALGSFAVAGFVAASFAVTVSALVPLRIADVIVAFAPGAQDTMMVLALALHLDPIYVGAHHLLRFLVVSLAIATAARRVSGRGGKADREQPQRPARDTIED